MPDVFGWALWVISLFIILFAVYYFWGGRTIYIEDVDNKEDK